VVGVSLKKKVQNLMNGLLNPAGAIQ